MALKNSQLYYLTEDSAPKGPGVYAQSILDLLAGTSDEASFPVHREAEELMPCQGRSPARVSENGECR